MQAVTARRRVVRGALIGVGVLIVAWLVACFFVVLEPATNHPAHADAILVLGGATTQDRLGTGLALAAEGYASTVLISEPAFDTKVEKACLTPPEGVTVVCFAPHPSTTRGEARQLRDQARAHGWHTVIVITSRYHISRSRWIVGRCFDGRVLMVQARGSISPWQYAYHFFYQTAGYVRAFTQRGC